MITDPNTGREFHVTPVDSIERTPVPLALEPPRETVEFAVMTALKSGILAADVQANMLQRIARKLDQLNAVAAEREADASRLGSELAGERSRGLQLAARVTALESALDTALNNIPKTLFGAIADSIEASKKHAK